MNRSSRARQWVPVFAFGFSGICMALLIAAIGSAAAAQTMATEQAPIADRLHAVTPALR